jgi:large subunit ribosomal protein L24
VKKPKKTNKFKYIIKKDDLVEVISGRDRGKRGKVLRVIPSVSKVIVDNINIVKRHQRPTQQEKNGGIIDTDLPLNSSKVMVVCPRCDKRTRIGWKNLDDGDKKRYCKKCGELIDKD